MAIFYFSNIEEVPITGRKRFNCYSKERAVQEGMLLYEMIMEDERGNILPDSDPRVIQVERVLSRLIPVSGMSDGNWEVHVIDDPGMLQMLIRPIVYITS